MIETRDLFLLVYTTNKNMYTMIPKRAFASHEDEQAFRDFVNLKIPPKPKARFNLKHPAVIMAFFIAAALFFLLCVLLNRLLYM